jgi:hydroxymethylbilane synthase
MIPETWKVSGKSLIDFSVAKKLVIPATDWIFFSSKNAVRYFFELGYTFDNKKLACVGTGTAQALKSFKTEIDFIGNNVDINITAQQFAKRIKNESCLFPISNISNKTIQKAITNPHQIVDIVVYNTAEKKDIELSYSDVLVFTSPSNVRIYCSKLIPEPEQKIIAIGYSTAQQLKKCGVHNFHLPRNTGEIGLIDSIINHS